MNESFWADEHETFAEIKSFKECERPMIEKIKKYDIEICNCCLGEHLETIESSDGNFFKVEDVEAIFSNIQQHEHLDNIPVYVSRCSWGYGDDCDESVCYAGHNIEDAKRAIFNFSFPNEYNNYGQIQHWEKGNIVLIDEIFK